MTNTAHTIDTALYDAVTDALRAEAKKVLESGTAAAVIGWQAGRRRGSAVPAIVTEPADAEKLIFSPSCVNNLALYLTKAKKEVREKGKLAVVAKGCDMKALAGLMGENQLKRDDIYIIGVACAGVYGPAVRGNAPLDDGTLARKCRECAAGLPEGADVSLGTVPRRPDFTPHEAAELARLEAMTPAERWAFWKEHFSRCIRCYACRQVCPFCYCEQCLCDRNRPQAVETTPRPAGNMAWHMVRAMHLAGRCAGCAECERACPMDIPLNLLNRKMAKELKELYGHEAGFQAKEKGPLAEYREDDDQSFIK
ncbi:MULTISPECIES: 4Fe-4S dicluster domain-containing protein [Geobacter]|uniref:4Fe-4S dicluster domain-containing protein n=1 Tax=Geobacter TaxID=28231 RepID=UPI00257321C3|nr:4Fe-4S dicluster domain-containing protein [Geobacter sulfurreducens]BEH08451.1 4Fe-4S dicluster domain-containing protein [Geobacter sulfurreducens subsp. ethanolicus]BET59930.1 4Fe-4S dicluster domain-containing protein [Geobacter sp. 60473]